MYRVLRGRLADTAIGASQLPALRPVIEPLKRLPLIRNWQKRRRLAHFLSEEGFASFYGVFGSFSEARDALPKSKEHNQRALTAEYVNVRRHRVFSYDYPVIYWLSVAFRHGTASVFDIGGSVGVHYHAYKKLLVYPPSLTWQVCDLPEIVQVGRELAARNSETQLTFTDTLDPASVQADIWITAGAIHYIENARPNSLLAACKKRPTHFILNKLPLYGGDDFVSAQNIGKNSFAPQYVYNRKRFLTDIESVGYHLVDSWEVPECSFYLPGHPEKSFRKFSGLYFCAD
jgi:putative methyltransferase (TIGR04325 family)